ncbi:glycosyltransferase family 2 protein [Leptolyngbya sp. CCNP1308]|uniref:glycosyltransferase family 2 protein n=1 Tax=Leptolyngbya sp. CCNP1308 TaxID=3110255 RepID=UPI002B217F24|nr:glycosyltransferase family 2 protein [Leptolyngbya sp. CCNP1308]MEA5452442.1 glycosyltransferase family 2 protein [Leptolyngbya sp. CCNP1308]
MLTTTLPTQTTDAMLASITPVILTYNEAANIGRTLQRLTWADRIVVIDSFSTDETLDILSGYPQVEVYQRPFDTHATQWNYGLSLVETPWVLSLDADYCLSDDLVDEFTTLNPSGAIDCYTIPFQYCVFGKPLRGTILPPRAALFRCDRATYIDDGHTQLLQCNGEVASLRSPILHDDRKSLNRWLWAQDRYALLEVRKQLESPSEQLGWSDRIRRVPGLSAPIILVYCLILKGGILDGWAGWHYAFQRIVAELILSIRLIEMRSSQ